ncbi:tyrosine-type recombinase/integrase [Mycoplasmatota bacterium WC44]
MQQNLLLTQLKDYYLNRCKHTTRIDTYAYYKKHLSVIVNYLVSINVKSTSDISNDTLYNFIENQKNKGLKNNTINKRLATLKQALRYCEKQELITVNPMCNFDLLSRDDVETVTIDKSILYSILTYFETEAKTPLLLRSKVITYILLDTGIRLNELRELRVNDLKIYKNQINLKYTKTNRHRTVFLTDNTVSIIEEYLKVVEPTDYLIVNITTKEKLSRYGMYKFFDEIKRKLNIPTNVSLSFHKFRHTYATLCLEHGASLEFIRKTLGHSDITTTQKYLHLSNNKLRTEHNMCSPVNLLI